MNQLCLCQKVKLVNDVIYLCKKNFEKIAEIDNACLYVNIKDFCDTIA